jgi:hypothetical protein
MSEVKKSRMKPRLGQLMAEKGGMYVAEALKRADATLEILREPSLPASTAISPRWTACWSPTSTTPPGSSALYAAPATSSASAAPSATRRSARRPLAVRPAGRGRP